MTRAAHRHTAEHARRCATALALAVACAAPLVLKDARAADVLWQSSDPRAYGHQLGDLVTRDIDIELPPGVALIDESLPQPSRANRFFDLRAIERSQPGPNRERLHLTWQVIGVREAAAFVDLPPLRLRLRGPDGEQPLFIDGRRIAVAPVAPPDAEPELMDDVAPQFIDTRPARTQTLAALGLFALMAAAWLFWRYALPWLMPQRRPFAIAWRELRRQRRRGATPLAAACATLHAAFNRSAGRTLLADGLPDFLHAHPAYAAARDDIAAFFAESERLLFAGRAPADPAAAESALLALCRRLRDIERAL